MNARAESLVAQSGASESSELFPSSTNHDAPPPIIGQSSAMQTLRRTIVQVARSARPVLVTGETGTGKDLVVRQIHWLSRHPAQLIDINCGALPELLFESQLFGHEKGAFTGAHCKHHGFFSSVGEGTLFLDEIAELLPQLQAKLLRALESGSFRPLGSQLSQSFFGRVIAATHVDLEQQVARGKFREDLLYRLNVLEVRVPALDERREDIPALVTHFCGKTQDALRFTPEAMHDLAQAAWPGNVRQLRNFVDRLDVFSPQRLVTREALQQQLEACARRANGARAGERSSEPTACGELTALARAVLRSGRGNKLELAQEALLREAMSICHGNKTAAARLIGVHRKIIERRLRNPIDQPGLLASE